MRWIFRIMCCVKIDRNRSYTSEQPAKMSIMEILLVDMAGLTAEEANVLLYDTIKALLLQEEGSHGRA